jgi:antitoxin component YwqK of YwqJK toxin-antitoxin module
MSGMSGHLHCLSNRWSRALLPRHARGCCLLVLVMASRVHAEGTPTSTPSSSKASPEAPAAAPLSCPPGTEVQEKKDDKGHLLARGCRQGSVNHGPMTFYDPAGWKQTEALFKNGQLDGKVTTYWPNGQKYLVGNYRAGKPDGRFVAHDDKGKVLGSYTLRAGTGTRIDWYPSGKKRQVAQLKNDQPDGYVTDFYENGQMEVRVPYKAGLKQGKAESWHPGGQKSGEAEYRDNAQEGLEVRWNEQGVKVLERTFQAGALHGKEWRWDDAGRFRECTCVIGGKVLWALPPGGMKLDPAESKQMADVVKVHPCP